MGGFLPSMALDPGIHAGMTAVVLSVHSSNHFRHWARDWRNPGPGSVKNDSLEKLQMLSSAHSFTAKTQMLTISNTFHSYSDYTRLLIRGAVILSTLERQARDLGLKTERLTQTLRHLEEGAFSIAVVGEFKRGKSTFVNALLGNSTLPMDVMPATASVTRIVYGRVPEAILIRHDGDRESIPIEKLSEYITKIDDKSAARAAEVREAIVAYPTLFCQNNVEIIDTPGLSDEVAMTRLTLDVIPKVDAAIFVISSLTPFSDTEEQFLNRLLDSINVDCLFFVVNYIDKLNNPDDIKRLMETIRARIHQAIRTITNDSSNTPSLQIYPVSSWQALVGKEKRDNSLYQMSLFSDLEKDLEHYLSSERGAATLSQAMQVIRESTAYQLLELSNREKKLEQSETDEADRSRARIAELNAIISDIEAHFANVEKETIQQKSTVQKIIQDKLQQFLGTVQTTLIELHLDDEHLKDSSVRLNLIRSALQESVYPLVDKLSQELVDALIDWGEKQDAAILIINQRLDRALTERETDLTVDTPATLPVEYREREKVGKNAMVTFAHQNASTLKEFASQFKEVFQPSSGLAGETTLAVAGKALTSESMQKSWGTIRGLFVSNGAEHAELEFRKSRDQLRERLRHAYTKGTSERIASLFIHLQLEKNATDAVHSLYETISTLLEREKEYIRKLAEWKKVELRIERTRQHAENIHKRDGLLRAQIETQELEQEAKQYAQFLAQVLSKSHNP
uniref:Dynamin family protein n=1 Tax=Candidatus Kentrum sp. LFY TaxID=2126342 RepID=A0A450UNT3_9GAMM|nr:MAG: Dynamin family protein [Candidatus Kentron sp. LFY]